MLKKINVDDLCLGMHLHELCGSWVDHPFWKTRFLLVDAADLAKLRKSGIDACWIDVSKGRDVAPREAAGPAPAVDPAPAARAAAPVATPVAASDATPVAAPAPVEPATPAAAIEDELGRAAALIRKSRELVVSMFQEARMGRAVDTRGVVPLVDEIAASVCRNAGALVSLARLKTHDDYSYMHSVAVCGLMTSLALRLGQGPDAVRDAGIAGLLHDVGKMRVPLEILNKPGRLTDAETTVMRCHPVLGHELLQRSVAVPKAALDVCLHHHERPDGKGYPHGLEAEAISEISKMGAICDVYDAITSHRPYHAAGDPAESLARMSEWARGGQFDMGLFAHFLKMMGVYPIGSLVRMRSGRLAVVVENHPHALLTPRVRVFFSTKSQMPIPVETLDTAASGCRDAVVGRESNAAWNFTHLDELWAGRDALARTARATA